MSEAPPPETTDSDEPPDTTDPERGEGKGSGPDDDDDPSNGFESGGDSQQVDDAQQTLDAIDPNTTTDQTSGGVDSDAGASGEDAATGDGEPESGTTGVGGSVETTDSDNTDDDQSGDVSGGETDGDDAGQSESESGGDGSDVDIANKDSFTNAELKNEDVAQQIGEKYDLADDQIEEIQTLGEDNLTPDAADSVNIDTYTEFTPMAEGDDQSGMSEGSMWIGENDDGDRVYITFFDSQTAGNPLRAGDIYDSLEKSLSDEAVESIGFPEFNVDNERKALVMEDAGAEDSNAVGLYHPTDASAEYTKENLTSAIAGKFMAGDTDLGGNIVVSSTGDFQPIDFDSAGNDLEQRDQTIAEKGGVLHADNDGVMDYAANKYTQVTRSRLGFTVSSDDVRERATELANEVDLDTFESELKDSQNISRMGQVTPDRLVSNIEALREGL